MAKVDLEDAAEVRRLHDVLRQRHAQLREAEPGTPEYDRLRALALAATDDLIAREEAIPLRRERQRRRRIRLIVQAAGGAAGIATVALVVLMIAGPVSWWHLVPALAVAATAAIVAGTAAPDRRAAAAALLTAAAAGLLVAVGTDLVPAWAVGVVVVALVAAVGLRSGSGEEAT